MLIPIPSLYVLRSVAPHRVNRVQQSIRFFFFHKNKYPVKLIYSHSESGDFPGGSDECRDLCFKPGTMTELGIETSSSSPGLKPDKSKFIADINNHLLIPESEKLEEYIL